MFRLLTLCLYLLSSLLVCSDTCAANKIIAVVDSTAITIEDVKNRMRLTAALSGFDESQPDALQALQRYALQSLIDEVVIIKHAAPYGFVITQEEVQDEMLSMAKSNGLSLDELNRSLKEISPQAIEEIRKQIKGSLTWKRYVNQWLRPSIDVTTAEITAALPAANSDIYHVQQITLNNLDIAKQIVTQLRGGGDFAKIAGEFSSDSTIDLGRISLQALPIKAANAILNTTLATVHNIVGPIMVQDSYVVYKVLPDNKGTIDVAQIEAVLQNQKLDIAVRNTMRKWRNKTFIKIHLD